MIRVTDTVAIERPPAEVFAYVTDPAKLPTWQDVEEVVQLTPGPVGVGTRFREVHKVLGVRREQITEVVAFEPGARFEIQVVEGPPPVDGRWDFAPAPAGTWLTFVPTARLPGPLAVAAPVVELMTALVMSRFHRRLKRGLEAR